MTPMVLTIGALDPTGADGLAADLRTFAALGVSGAPAATMIAGQTRAFDPACVAAQIDMARAAGPIAAVKLGALGSAAIAQAVVGALSGIDVPVIADPSLARRDGGADPELVAVWREMVLPLALVITPNLAESALLTELPRAATRGEMAEQAEALNGLGCTFAIVSGGHGRGETSTDIIAVPGNEPMEMRAERLATSEMHGLSATLAAAIAAHMAQEIAPAGAIQFSKLFVSNAILEAVADSAEGEAPLSPHQLARMWRRAGVQDDVAAGFGDGA